MTEEEQLLFLSFLAVSKKYVEFGSGGSTVAACEAVRDTVVSVDSVRSWQGKVARACRYKGTRLAPTLVEADIGLTGPWGYPKDSHFRHFYPRYSRDVWNIKDAVQADLCLIDGRFRVACFLNTLLFASNDIIILFHDYYSRRPYHVVGEFAEEIAKQGELAAFRPKASYNKEEIERLLENYKFVSA